METEIKLKRISVMLTHSSHARLADQGGVPMPMTPADFGKLIADETEKWAKAIQPANIKPE